MHGVLCCSRNVNYYFFLQLNERIIAESGEPEQNVGQKTEEQLDLSTRYTIPTESATTSESQSKSRKKKKLRDQRLETAFQILTPNASSSSNDDETQDFANFVVKKLRKYDTLTRSAVQHAIMGVLLNADMSLHQMQQPNTQAGPSNPFGVHPLVAETPISGMNLLSMPHRSQRPPPADTPSTSSTPQTTGECVPSPGTSEDELLLRDFVS